MSLPLRLIFNYGHIMHRFLILLCALIPQIALAITPSERREFLDTIRPEVTRLAGQPIRFKVDTLNYQGGWAVLVGEVMALAGKSLDWGKAKNCDPTLDKVLWVVAQKNGVDWQVKEMFICSPEPPYWYLEPKEAFLRPCGIYAGLQTGANMTVEQACKAFQSQKGPAQP